MIRHGFIRSKDEIKFLILYSLSFVKFPINFDNILDVCTWCDDGFDYFEFNIAFNELVASHHIEEFTDEAVKTYIITRKGIDTSIAFENKLPVSIKELANISALRVTRTIRRDSCISASTARREAENDFVVTLKMDDIFALDFMVVSESQANLLEMQFKQNAEKIYSDILYSLTKDYE